jgi:MFS family permease
MDFLTTNPFARIFGVLAIACAIIVYLNNRNDTIPTVTNEFKKFQFQYLFVYFMALAADWLQGPYFYAIYASYNFEIGEIGFLFVVGFGSSMIFGTVVGSIADKYGRKNICLLFCVMYSTSCILINFPNWYLLLVGRLLGGISTSILFSTFEAWMIYEHFHRGFADDWLDYTFYLQVFGNGLIAIGAGLLGSFVKSTFDSYGAPFITAVGFLIVALVGIVVMWSENYGNQSGNATANFIQAFKTIQTDFKCFCLGVAQSLFEAAMYTFVFM